MTRVPTEMLVAGRGSESITTSASASDSASTSLTLSPSSSSSSFASSLSSPSTSGITTSGWPVEIRTSTGSPAGRNSPGSGSWDTTRPLGTSSDASRSISPSFRPWSSSAFSASALVMLSTVGTDRSSGPEPSSIGPKTAAATSSARIPTATRARGHFFRFFSSSPSPATGAAAPKIEVDSDGRSWGRNVVSSATAATGATTGFPARNRSMSARISAAVW